MGHCSLYSLSATAIFVHAEREIDLGTENPKSAPRVRIAPSIFCFPGNCCPTELLWTRRPHTEYVGEHPIL